MLAKLISKDCVLVTFIFLFAVKTIERFLGIRPKKEVAVFQDHGANIGKLIMHLAVLEPAIRRGRLLFIFNDPESATF